MNYPMRFSSLADGNKHCSPCVVVLVVVPLLLSGVFSLTQMLWGMPQVFSVALVSSTGPWKLKTLWSQFCLFNSRAHRAPPAFPTLHLGNSLQAMSWGSPRAYPICFLSLRGSLSFVTWCSVYSFIYFDRIFSCLRQEGKFSPCWSILARIRSPLSVVLIYTNQILLLEVEWGQAYPNHLNTAQQGRGGMDVGGTCQGPSWNLLYVKEVMF